MNRLLACENHQHTQALACGKQCRQHADGVGPEHHDVNLRLSTPADATQFHLGEMRKFTRAVELSGVKPE